MKVHLSGLCLYLGLRAWLLHSVLCLRFDIDVHQLCLGAIFNLLSVKLPL
jgi:hypothetical protein